MSEEIVFEEPEKPRLGRRERRDWADVANQLRQHPGEWALVDTDVPGSLAANYRNGVNVAFRPVGAFEFTLRGVHGSRAEKLYARYVGGLNG